MECLPEVVLVCLDDSYDYILYFLILLFDYVCSKDEYFF